MTLSTGFSATGTLPENGDVEMRRRSSLLLLCGLCLAACTHQVPRRYLPPPLTGSASPDPVKVVTVPLPVIATSPNEGNIFGGLVAFLLHNRRDEVNTLLAPQVNYNENFRVSSTLYGAFYPAPEREWEFNLSKSSNVNEDYEVLFSDRTLFGGKLRLDGFLFHFTDGSARFFGFESEAAQENESNYGDRESGFRVSVGYEIAPGLQVVFGERFKEVDIRRGAVTSLPFIRDVFSPEEVTGIEGFSAHAQELALVYSTLDAPDQHTRGLFARAGVEGSFEALGSSADYRRYGVELKGYLPLDDGRFITVGRVAYSQVLGDDVPFLERSTLGGEKTLRGFGRNRFIDSSYLLMNLEERIRLFRWEVFDVLADWELAPFLDVGGVMERLDEADPGNFEVNPGIGFRAIVRPNIVGRVDVGFGREGPAVFVGLDYPF